MPLYEGVTAEPFPPWRVGSVSSDCQATTGHVGSEHIFVFSLASEPTGHASPERSMLTLNRRQPLNQMGFTPRASACLPPNSAHAREL